MIPKRKKTRRAPAKKPAKQKRPRAGKGPQLRVMSVVPLDPDAPGLDDATRRRRRALAALQAKSPTELLQIAVEAGIYTRARRLTPPYVGDLPSIYRVTD
jgi:hypothetical protein